MSLKDCLSVNYVKSLFRYEDGRLYWLPRPLEHFPSERIWRGWNTKWAGKEAGAGSSGDPEAPRWLVGINNKKITRYEIVWAIHKGVWPKYLDHINRNQADDRIENLRESTHSQNTANQGKQPRNKSGYKGVSWNSKMKKWNAKIGINWKRVHLGYFETPQEAHDAYVKAAREHWGEFACDGE